MTDIFGKIKFSWLKTIIFAIITGIYTGAVMLVPILKGTSFQDIGISYECWVLFAVIIVTNCKKCTEAMLKCFVFFLISQPLVYLVQIIFGDLSFQTALGYYLHIWLPMTILTLPGGLVAYFCKKENIGGCIIMSLGNTIQIFLGVSYALAAKANFPNHILTAIFCFVSAIIMAFGTQKEKKYRILSIVLPIVFTAIIIISAKLLGLTISPEAGF